ncbi:hypothetical protein Tco_0978777 [Tanacetum coccineum]|uniref:Uncharacterized protein n=1 Tax=Tanacetum coccineum TaxID=301880 RepID=A0ABQ5EP19_9ASTR
MPTGMTATLFTENVQEKAPGICGTPESRGNQVMCNVTTATGSKVICYNIMRREVTFVRTCKEPKRKIILADVECTAPYDQPQDTTTEQTFSSTHRMHKSHTWMKTPMLLFALWPTCPSTSGYHHPVNEYTPCTIISLIKVDDQFKFNMPTHTIPMLSKKPKAATADLHKDLLGQGEEVLVHKFVSMLKKYERKTRAHVRTQNGFYEKLNALKFVPQQELSREQAYWLPANEIASQASNPDRPVTPFVHNVPPQVKFSVSSSKGLMQFYHQFEEHFKKPHSIELIETIFKEVKEYEQIFDDLDAEYERCVLDNKNLTIEKKNLLIKNDCLIAECLEKDICSIVLTSDIVVPPSSNCLCEDLRSACDREHTKVLELEAEVLKQQKMVIESEKRNCLQCNYYEIKQDEENSFKEDDTIRNLDAQINIMKVLNVGSTEGSCDHQALDTDRIQLQDMITSLRIQLDGLKVENVSLKRRYDELSKANTHSRTAYTKKLSALTSENTKLKALVHGATGKTNPVAKKKQVTFQEPHRTSNRPTQKPPVQQNKKPNVSVNLSTRTKPATASRKPMPKSHTQNHRILPSKSVNAWRPTRKVVGSVKPQWKPTGRHL